jgi:putative ABC transport system permease protein
VSIARRASDGGAYGLIGAASVLDVLLLGDIVLSVPWLQVTVLPARRAARTPPVAAIAG